MKLIIFTFLALLGIAAAMPQGVTDKITPAGAAPASCSGTVDGKFEVTIIELSKRDKIPTLETRETCGGNDILVVTLADGVLKDAHDRTGYIASNFQFQFDGPPQAGALITAGFSVCGNGSVALGPSTVFYQCLSGTFYNLYDRHWAAQCEPVHINAIPCGGSASIGQIPDGQIIGTTMVATTIVTVLSDGQPQVVPTSVPIPMCQIGDGQVQAHTTPCASIPLPVVTAKPVSQIPDGQIQVPPPGKPVSQIPDGQIQVPPTGKPVSQIPDGQIQAPPQITLPAAPPVTTASASATTTRPPLSVTSSPSVAPSAPPSQAGAGRIASASLLAVVFGILGAAWCI